MASVRRLHGPVPHLFAALLALSSLPLVPSAASAQQVLPLGSSISDSLLPVTQTYYSIPTAADGSLTITLGPTPGRNVQLGFAAPDYTLGTHGDAWGSEYSVVVPNLKAGGYYASLYLYGFATDDPAAVTLSTTFEPAPLAVDAEPNDEFTTALWLQSAVQVTGHLGYDGFTSDSPYDGDDYYAIDVLDGGTLDATLQMAAASANNALVLLDSNYATVQSQDITLPENQVSIHRDGLAGGTYYLQAHQYGFGHGSYSLAATVSDPTGGVDGDVELTLGVPMEDVIAGATEEYYSFTTPADGALTLTVIPPEGRNVQLGFTTPDKTLGAHGDSWGSEYSVVVANLRAGSYYAKLFAYGFTSDSPAAVTLLATFEPAPLSVDPEPDDGFPSALPLAPGVEATGHLGYDGFTEAAPYDEADYYSLVVSEGSSLEATLRMESASANNALQLFDANQSLIASQDITLPSTETTLFGDELASGTYYIKVHQYGFGYGAYRLTANVAEPEGGSGLVAAAGATSTDSTGNTGSTTTAGNPVQATGGTGSVDPDVSPTGDEEGETGSSNGTSSSCSLSAPREPNRSSSTWALVVSLVGLAFGRRRSHGRSVR